MKRTTLVAAAAVLFTGAAQAADTELIIYKEAHFRGPSQVVNGEVANLEGGFARDGSSLVVKGGYWEVCDEDHFKGNCRVLEPGKYPRLDSNLNEQIVSVRFLGNDEKVARRAQRQDRQLAREERRGRVAKGAIDLYGRPNFRGPSVRVEDNAKDLWEKDFDSRASSAIVREGTWQLCSEPGYSGSCLVVGPGEYPRLAGLDDRVSSIRQVY